MLTLGFKHQILNLNKVYNTVHDQTIPLHTFETPPQHLINKMITKLNGTKIKITYSNIEPNITDLNLIKAKKPTSRNSTPTDSKEQQRLTPVQTTPCRVTRKQLRLNI